MSTATDYESFLASKRVSATPSGFKPTRPMHPSMFPFQAVSTEWAIRMGRAALWLETGLGKTLCQLEWSRHVVEHTNRPVLILCPLAVAKQTGREAAKFGIEATVCRKQADVKPGINVTNYQMLKHFDPSKFAGVVIDESDILANFSGATKKAILEAFRDTPFKLDCSATPAPNDHLEIGNHADFLGVMESSLMISRWFINDGGEAGAYRLKGHAVEDFWRWVASWATAIGKPSDLGYDDGPYALPPLHVLEHVVEVDLIDGRSPGQLFRTPSMSATSMHEEMRRTAKARADKVADLVLSRAGESPWLIWCNTDYEADELRRVIPDAVEVRGSESVDAKEDKLEAFSLGKIPILLSKPSLCGHGMNWQHCRDVAYVGLTYSFKRVYQSLRRCWRFGQTASVTAHMVMAETEGLVIETVKRKAADHEEMKRSMVAAMVRHGLGAEYGSGGLDEYTPSVPMTLPAWMQRSS